MQINRNKSEKSCIFSVSTLVYWVYRQNDAPVIVYNNACVIFYVHPYKSMETQ